jgi:putative tricarboxylic transport membrane protein
MLKDGIPWLPVMIGLLAVPSILYMLKNSQSASVALSNNSLYHDDNNYSAVAARGGIVGFLLGTVPGLSYILSSIAAAKVEEKLSADPRKIVVASEAANNAGAIGMLLPLFTLGIPITASESVLFVLLTTNTSTQNLSLIFQTHWIDIITYFVLINVVLFVLAWLCSSYINSFISSRLKLLAISSLLLAVSGTLYFGYWSQNLAMTCVVLVVFSIVGSQFRRLDWSPLVYSLIMYPYIESTLYKIQQIYF